MTKVTLTAALLASLLALTVSPAFSQSAVASPLAAEALYLQLRSVGLDKTRVYKIRDGALDRAAIHISLDDGTIAFTSDVGGRITGAFFTGEGEILLTPPDTTERGSLAFFTGAAILEEKFSTAYFRFNDDVFEQLKSAFRTPDETATFVSRWNATAQNLAQEDALRELTSFINTSDTDRFLHAYLQGSRLGTFDVRYDSLATEQISAGEHRTLQGDDFYDLWTSFATRSARATRKAISSPSAHIRDFEISDFKIQAQIRPPTDLQAKAVLTVLPHQDGKRLLLFELSRLLQVSKIESGGHALEFIHNPAIEGSQLARQGNDVLAVILPAPTHIGQKLELSFEYSGAVLSEAANGLLFVGAHGTWYPNIGFAKAAFELEFNYPVGWTLIATGHQKDSRTAGAEQIARWASERPIPVAGFNLGKYSRTTTRAGTATVATYATSNVERGFPQTADAQPVIPGLLRDRHSQPPSPEIDRPSPARNAQVVANSAVKALEFYQQRFGPFPYSELALTQFPGNVSQGWPGMIFLFSYAFLNPTERERLQPDPKLRLALELTVPHEVAHQWWGDLVTWDSYRDQWIMEALANYSALMLLETRNPAAFRELLQKFRDDLLAKSSRGQQLTVAGPVTLGVRLSSSQFPNGYEAISYGRGTWLIHMLRCMLRDADRGRTSRPKGGGDEAFLRALRKLRTQYEGKPVTTADFISIFESELPSSLWYEGRKSLDWFYEGWVNGSSVPAYGLRDLKFTDKAGSTLVTGTIVQEHAPDSLVTAVPIYSSASGKNTFLTRVFVEGPETQFHVTASSGTRKILIDPEQTLLARGK